MPLDEIISAVIEEYEKATKNHGPFHNAHEAYAVLLEEVDELWEGVKIPQFYHERRQKVMELEAIQVAAMAIRFLKDVCGM